MNYILEYELSKNAVMLPMGFHILSFFLKSCLSVFEYTVNASIYSAQQITEDVSVRATELHQALKYL